MECNLETMRNVTLSMHKDKLEMLRAIANKEHRSLSKQVIVMMEYYIDQYKEK